MIKVIKKKFWFAVSVLICLYYGLISLSYAFSQKYIIQDDVRHHIVWLQRFIDPQLFDNDLIAEYFTKLAPVGFEWFYWLWAKIGIEPLILAKLLPLFLGLIATVYIYFFSLQILPLPIYACLSSLFFNQLIWLNDDLNSATPRAFLYPLFAAFLYYLSTKSFIACAIALLLSGLFYPQILLLEVAIITVRLFEPSRRYFIKLTKNKRRYLWWMASLIIGVLVLYPITKLSPELATTVSKLQMQQIPEFSLHGRNQFFGVSWWRYWLMGDSGLNIPLFPAVVWCGFLLPFLLKTKLPIVKQIKPTVNILFETVAASLLMFSLAHLMLPKLHLPNRYTYHSLRFVSAIASAIVLTALLDISWRWLQKKRVSKTHFKLKEKLAIFIVCLLLLTIIVIPAIPYIFIHGFQNWQVGTIPEVYEYLADRPQDTLVASLSETVNNIPAFAERSILFGEEFSLAYHPYYQAKIIPRIEDMLEAQYSNNLSTLKAFIDRYGIDYILLDKNAFTPEYLLNKNWLIYSSWSDVVWNSIEQLKLETPVLAKFVKPCSVVTTETTNLIATSCIIDSQ